MHKVLKNFDDVHHTENIVNNCHNNSIQHTDLHIYILDAVPPVHIVWNHVDTAYHCKWRIVYVEFSQSQ